MIDDTPSIPLENEPTPEMIDPLHLDLEERDIVRIVKQNIKSSVNFYKDKGLFDKQKKNLDYYYGRQKLYRASNQSLPYKENIVYEAISRQKPIELSRLPDLTVKPGDDTPETKKSAEQLTGILNSDTKQDDNRKLLGLAIKQEPLYYYSVIKARWNAEKGPFGDYEFVNVHPDNVVWDHNCPNSDTNNMRFVAERAKLMLKEVIMMFPEKEEEIKDEFGWSDREGDDEAKMATQIDIWEVWFHWYDLKGKDSERIDGVIWIYGQTALKKMKNPYFDYQGRKKTFSKVMEEKDAFTIDEIFQMIDVSKGQETEDQVVYNNYFQDPEKPYFFMVYENMGEHPVGETSRVEQIWEFQDLINMDGSIITDMNLRSRGKDLFDTNAIPQTTIDSLSYYDIDQALGLDVPQGSSINNVHSRIMQPPATQQQYRSMQENRSKGLEMLGVGPSLRGLSDPNSTLGQEQMSREGDYGLADDIVNDTINAAAKWQARWSMQFIKLFYTKPHMRHILGKDGDVLHTKLTQDMVDNGMEVVVSASGVDKMQRKRMAMENMKLGVGDPLSYYEDTDQSNPKERALRSMMAQGSPQMYIQQYLMDKPPLSPDNPPMPGQEPVPGAPAEQAMAASPGGQPAAPAPQMPPM